MKMRIQISRYGILCILLFFCNSIILAQTSKQEIFNTPQKSGGVNFAYPIQQSVKGTPTPKGYLPFYISHFGRHGSRYLVEDKEYKHVLDVFHRADSANALTPLGKAVLQRLQTTWQEAQGNGGDLTPLGISQIKGIATRMYQQYPEALTASANVSAVSTTVGRCIHSMNILCQQLKELSPGLSIVEDANPKLMDYLNYHTKQAVEFRSAHDTWKVRYDQFEKGHVHPARLIKTLFSDGNYLIEKTDPASIMWDLYGVASILQDMRTSISLYDIFEKEELFDLWQCKNYSLYVQYANAAENNGMMMENAKPLLKNIIDNANHIIETKGKGASFRFGHDGNIIPLAMLLHLQNCYNSVADPSEFYKAWSDFKVAPMAANIQIVFFRNNDTKDILVKFLQNEYEVLVPPVKSSLLPYYRWQDVEAYYASLL